MRRVLGWALLVISFIGWGWSAFFCDTQCLIEVTNHISWAALVLTALGLVWTAQVKEKGTDEK